MGSAATALQALRLIAANQPLGVSELARRLNVSKASGQRALDTLAEDNWIRRSEAHPGRWVLSPQVLDLAAHVGSDTGLREAARPIMTEMALATTETVHLTVLDDTEIVVIDEVPSTQIVRIHWPVGRRSPTHASANGKAILAALPADEVDHHLPAELAPLTDQTISDRLKLRDELELTAARGYAIQRGELRTDVAAIAAAVTPKGSTRPVGALGLFLPIQRLPAGNEDVLGRLVSESARTVSDKLAQWGGR